MTYTVLVEKEITDLAATAEKTSYSVLEVAKSYEIDDSVMAEMAGSELVAIKAKQKELDEQRKNWTRPLDDKKKEIMNLFKPAEDLLKDAEQVLKSALGVWQEKERQRIALERKVQQEEIARQQREAAEAERNAREAAAQAMREGNEEKAQELVQAANAQAVQVEVLQFAPPVSAEPQKIAGVSGRQDWDFEITDISKIPREYLMIDETKIRRVVKALGSEANIPGVRAFQKTVMSVRTKR